MGPTVDLVADLGEGFGAYSMGDDAALLDIVSSANIACGFHAGDPDIMNATVAECVRRGVGIGAHPSFPDLRGFGRRAMDLTADEVRNDVLYQFGALSAFAAYHGAGVAHLAPARPPRQPRGHPRRLRRRPWLTPPPASTRT